LERFAVFLGIRMETTPIADDLTPERIRALLKAGTDARATPAYQRLLEIYCVVKAGGLTAQVAVAQRLQQQEQTVLEAEIASLRTQAHSDSRIQALEQERWELDQAIGDRLHYLSTIRPEEAVAVAACLAEIDAHFQKQQGATPRQER
jgi:hypothetical protein